MIERAWHLPAIREARAAWARWRFTICLREDLAEKFLELLLGFMAAALVVDPDLRRHAQYTGRYAFRSKDGSISLGASMDGGLLRVSERPPPSPHATVIFRDGRALMSSLLSAQPDLLGALLRQDVSFEGNLNYVYRLAYLARRLQLSLTKRPDA
jgi:hypothetical protein